MSEYEAREAAIFGHYNWVDFEKLDTFERAACVAHYRMQGIVKSNVDEIVADWQKAHTPKPR